MLKRFSIPATISLAAAGLLPAGASAETGAQLHDKHCTSCHDERVYTREDRRVTSLDALTKQVQRCEHSLGLKWFDDDIAAVTSYLNTSYYKFK